MNRAISKLIIAGLFCMLTACSQSQTAQEYIDSGKVFADSKDWKSAIIEFKNAVKEDPENAQARALLGKAYLETNNTNAAIKELNRAIQLGHESSVLQLPLGRAYLNAGDNQKLVDSVIVDTALSNSIQASIYALRGIAFLRLNDMSSAETELQSAKLLDGEAIQVRLAWADFEASNGNIEAQKRWLLPLLERDGGVAEAWSRMGEIEQNKGEFSLAEEAYSRAIEIRKAPSVDHAKRSFVRVALDDIDGANADIEYLKAAGVNWPILAHAEGLIDLKGNQYEKAQVHFLEVLSKQPNYSPSQFLLAISYFHQGKYQSSIDNLELFLADHPENATGRLIYAASLLASQQSAEALDLLESLNERFPADFRILSLLSEAYFKTGDSENGLDAMRKAVSVEPDRASARLNLGVVLINNSKTAILGQSELKKALELDPGLERARVSLFLSYLREKQFDEAMNIAESVERDDDAGSLGANLVAMAYLAQNLVDQSKQKLLETLENYPADIVTSENLARVYYGEENIDKTRDVYLNVIDAHPNHLNSLIQLAFLSHRDGDTAGMMEWLHKAVERNPGESKPRLILGSQLLRQGEPDQSVRILEEIRAEDKLGLEFVALMSRANIQLGKPESAKILMNGFIDRNPKSPIGYYLMSQIHAIQGNQRKLRSTLNKTLELQSDHLMAQVLLARLELVEGNDEAFEKRLEHLQDIHPGEPQIEMLKALRSSTHNDFESAIKVLTELQVRSDQPEVALEIARNQWRSGDRKGAISSLELWLQKNKSNRVKLLLAEFYLLDNQAENAVAIYESLENVLPKNVAILNNLAWSLRDVNPVKGIEYARKANEINPENPYIMDTLAMLLHKSGDNPAALEMATRAADKAPDILDIQVNLADILVANNQIENAKAVLEGALQNTTQQEEINLINSRLESIN